MDCRARGSQRCMAITHQTTTWTLVVLLLLCSSVQPGQASRRDILQHMPSDAELQAGQQQQQQPALEPANLEASSSSGSSSSAAAASAGSTTDNPPPTSAEAVAGQEQVLDASGSGGTLTAAEAAGAFGVQQDQEQDQEEQKHEIKVCQDPSVLVKPKKSNVWLYSLVACTFPGTPALLRHWLDHYVSWGFEKQHILLTVHRRDEAQDAIQQCDEVERFLREQGIGYEVWTDTYESNAHLQHLLGRLQRAVKSPWDWIAMADSDELHDYGEDYMSVHEYVAFLDRKNFNAARGTLHDRVAPGGQLIELGHDRPLWQQMPYTCDLRRSRVIGGWSTKAMLFRAYLRASTGNHVVIPPTDAHYWEPSQPGELHRNGWYGVPDLRSLVPYTWWGGCYRHQRPPDEKYFNNDNIPYFPGTVRYAPRRLTAFHFKWHWGVVDNARKRLEHYKGNMTDREDGKPRFAHYKESEQILNATASGAITLEHARCRLRMRDNRLRVWQQEHLRGRDGQEVPRRLLPLAKRRTRYRMDMDENRGDGDEDDCPCRKQKQQALTMDDYSNGPNMGELSDMGAGVA